MDDTNNRTIESKIDLPTVVAVTIVVYFLCCSLHEAVGHGGAATALGVQVTHITTAYCRQTGATESQARIIAGAGIPVNLLFGCLAILLRRKLRHSSDHVLHYFLWLFGHMNLFSAGGYLMAFSTLKIGDINGVVRGLAGETFLRITLLGCGVAISLWTFFHAGRTLHEFMGDGDNKIKRGIALTMIPYLIGGAVNVGASLLGAGNSALSVVLISSIGASFGGNFPLLWIPLLPSPASQQEQVRAPTRSAKWIVAGVVFLCLYLLLGRGIILT